MFGAIPAPYWVIEFGVVRRACTEPWVFRCGLVFVRWFVEEIRDKEVNYFHVAERRKNSLFRDSQAIDTLLDINRLKVWKQ